MPRPVEEGRSPADVVLLGAGRQKGKGEDEFSDWLQRTLAAERLAFAGRLQQLLQSHLVGHHEKLLAEIATQLDQGSLEAVEVASEPLEEPAAEKTTGSETEAAKEASAEVCQLRTYRSGILAEVAAGNASEAPATPMVRGWLSRHHFELICSGLIFANLAAMAAEVQWNGCRLAAAMEHPDCTSFGASFSSSEAMRYVFDALAVFFSCCFLVEILIRVRHESATGWRALCNAWIIFDCVVLGFSLADCCERFGGDFSVGLSFNPIVMRAARVARMLRIVKVLRTTPIFQTLFLLVNSIMASRRTLICFVMIIFTVVTCAGLLTNQLLFSHMADETVPEANRREVYEYFGSYTRMIVTMFEITLGNWAPPCRTLMTNVHQYWGLLVVGYRCIFCFSLVNVTQAAFITETSQAASSHQVLMMRKMRQERKVSLMLREVFREIDASGDGLMTLEELRSACKDTVMKSVLEMIELEVQDIEELFGLLDNGEGQVRQEDFVKEVLRLRGEAKCSRQVAMMKILKDMRGQLSELQAQSKAVSRAATLAGLRSQWSKELSSRGSGAQP